MSPLTGQALTNMQNLVSVASNLQQLQTALANAQSAVIGDDNAIAALNALSDSLSAEVTEAVIDIAEGYQGANNTNGS